MPKKLHYIFDLQAPQSPAKPLQDLIVLKKNAVHCRRWVKRGAVNFVVAPRLLENQRRKHQKTDRLDARSLLDNLESYLRGKRDAMGIVAVPSPEQEQQRSVVRFRRALHATTMLKIKITL